MLNTLRAWVRRKKVGRQNRLAAARWAAVTRAAQKYADSHLDQFEMVTIPSTCGPVYLGLHRSVPNPAAYCD